MAPVSGERARTVPTDSDHAGGAEVAVEARVERLPALLRHVEQTCERGGVDPETREALRLAVEEVCVNVIKHGYSGRTPGPIRLACAVLPDEVRVTVTDEAPPFDPARVQRPDLESAWEERPVGGLGWHLVRQVTDEVHHEVTAQGGNRLVLVKRRP